MVRPADPQQESTAPAWNWSRLFRPRNQAQHVHAEGRESAEGKSHQKLQLTLRALKWDPLRIEDLAKKRHFSPITLKGRVGMAPRRFNPDYASLRLLIAFMQRTSCIEREGTD